MGNLNAKLVFLVINIFFYNLISINAGEYLTYSNPGFIFQEFENPVFPTSGWNFNGTTENKWRRTILCSGYGTGTGTLVAEFFNCTNYNFDFETCPFGPSSSGDSLLFDYAYATWNDRYDQLFIYTSSNNGNSWINLALFYGASLKTAPTTRNLFVPSSGQWGTKRIALPAGTNKIKFSGVPANGNNLYVDNIRIGNAYSHDAGVSGIYEPKFVMTQRACTPKVLVRNYGTTMQSFNVSYSISPGNYINTQTVTNLTPGQSAQVTFPEYTFTSNGNFSLKAYTSAAGDENSSNDTVISNVLITSAPRNIVLEYCTGTWCSWCPCAREQAMLILNSFPNAVVLAYHGDINSNDPFRIFNGNQVMDMLDFFVYPYGIVERKYNVDWMSIYSSVETRFYSSPEAAVNIAISNKTYNETTRELNVNYNAAALANLTGQYKVSYIITEDNIIYSQAEGPCGGASNYIHHWVVRNMVNGAAGENMNTGGVWNSGQTISKNFSAVLNESWVPVNCKLQILIYKDSVPLNHAEILQCIKTSVMPTGINNQHIEIPGEVELSQNYPNPFNPKTNIKFAIPKPGNVTLTIFDITGKQVSVCLDGYQKAGYYNVEFDGTELASGIYFYKLSVDKEQYAVKKMVLLK